MSFLSWIPAKQGVSYGKSAVRGVVSRGQGPKVAHVLPENLEEVLNFPDRGSIFTRPKVHKFKVTSPAAPPHSHTELLFGSRSKLKAGLSSKTLC